MAQDVLERDLRRCATEDVEDIERADLFMAFAESPSNTRFPPRGGRHVEMGVAIEIHRHRPAFRIMTVWRRENVFHYLPEVEFYPTFNVALEAL